MIFNSTSDRNPSYSGKNNDGRDPDNSCILEDKIWSWVKIGKVGLGQVQKREGSKKNGGERRNGG